MTNLATQIGAADPLFELHPAPSLLHGRDGEIVHANAALQQLMRAGGASIEGARLADFFPEVAAQLAATATPLCLKRVAVRRPDGSNLIARLQAVPNARYGLTLLCLEDLSDHEQELSAANKEFESLTSAAGHDLRGPLRILKGFAEALDDECGATLNEECRTFLKEILKASDRMEGLIDGLLTFSRAGRAELSCEKLDIGTLADLVHYDLRHAAVDRSVHFEMQPGITAWGDVRQMMTILRTLLGNAWKYTSRTGQAAVRLYTEQRDGAEWICVSDNGAGFDMGQATRLFRPFTRLHRHDEFAGHGMGLATVARIVQRHGGRIEAEGAVDKGATVRFWLPRPD
ncbi:MAG TPA: ATP-binding protein [Steroidobacteraceae bacterium]|jgi:light-regulated signal transduction histidine kinase (bacteriophytochrome)|nr:ATP-binding protein [Steroidobacteraceae bacterium]